MTNTLLTHNDLILFDHNNHKSNHHNTLIQTKTTPIYLKTSHNPFNFINDIDTHYFNKKYLHQQIHDITPKKTDLPHPYRLTIIQLKTYNDTIYNTHQIIDTVKHLYNYILFNST